MRMILAATLAIAPLAIAPLLAKDNDSACLLRQPAARKMPDAAAAVRAYIVQIVITLHAHRFNARY